MPKSNEAIFPRLINGKIIFLLLMLMFLTHIVIFVIYSQRNSSAEFKINREVISRQVINFIQTVENTPIEEQEKMVNTLDIPNFKITIDELPKWKEQFINASLWQILKKISAQSPSIQLSYFLGPDRWLNITAGIIPTSWGMQWVLLSLEITIIIAIIFSLWTINRFTGPLQKFTQAAERLGVDLQTEPLPIYGPKVVQIAGKAINKMQERIRDLIQARTQMLAAISHDLRTPITRLKLRAQYIDASEQQEKIIKDLDEMEAMISETLAFARDDNKNEQRVKLDLVSLLSVLCEDFSDVDHQVEYTGPSERITIIGGPITLKRVFSNLIENAVKYAGSASVGIEIERDDVVVIIDDNGPGIPEEQLEKVFQPFFRGEHSRSRETGGTGLGLAVARDYIRAHGGNITLESRRTGGLRAKVYLPRMWSHD